MRQFFHQFDRVDHDYAQEFNIHRLVIQAPNGFCPCVTKTENEFMMANFERIERTREKETQKNWIRAIEANHDTAYQHNPSLLEPVPNQ